SPGTRLGERRSWEGSGMAVDPRLSFLWLEVTGKCQLACEHCYAESGPVVPVARWGGMTGFERSMKLVRWVRCRSSSSVASRRCILTYRPGSNEPSSRAGGRGVLQPGEHPRLTVGDLRAVSSAPGHKLLRS